MTDMQNDQLASAGLYEWLMKHNPKLLVAFHEEAIEQHRGGLDAALEAWDESPASIAEAERINDEMARIRRLGQVVNAMLEKWIEKSWLFEDLEGIEQWFAELDDVEDVESSDSSAPALGEHEM